MACRLILSRCLMMAVPMLRERLEEFARTELPHDDHVIVEATGNAAAVIEVLAPLRRSRRHCQPEAGEVGLESISRAGESLFLVLLIMTPSHR